MKFTKTAVALAIAGIAVAPLAQADVTLSGSIGINLTGTDQDDGVDADGNPTSPGDPTLSGDDSVLNVSATHTMNSGLTAYGNYRLDGALTDDAVISDAVRIGIKGGFGDFRVGDVVNPIEYGQTAGDILTDIGKGKIAGGIDTEEQAIGYTGAFGPVELGLYWSPANNRDAVGAGVKFSLGGFAVGLGAGDIDETSVMSAGVSFGYAGASIALAYKDFDNEAQTIGAKVGYSISGVSLALTYEAYSGDVNDGDAKVRFDAGYNLGGGMSISTRINSTTSDTAANEVTDYRLQLAKSF